MGKQEEVTGHLCTAVREALRPRRHSRRPSHTLALQDLQDGAEDGCGCHCPRVWLIQLCRADVTSSSGSSFHVLGGLGCSFCTLDCFGQNLEKIGPWVLPGLELLPCCPQGIQHSPVPWSSLPILLQGLQASIHGSRPGWQVCLGLEWLGRCSQEQAVKRPR